MLIKPLKARIKGRWINLREISEMDTDAIISLRSNEGRAFLSDTTRESHLSWLRSRYQPADNDYYFVIEDRETSAVIGSTALYAIDWEKRTGEWGRWVVKDGPYRRHAPLESAFLLHRFGFEQLGLSEIFAHFRESNKHGRNFVIRRLGQNLEAMRARVVRADDLGSFDDVCVASLTKVQFDELAPGLQSTIESL